MLPPFRSKGYHSFAPVVSFIQSSRNAALRSVNRTLIELYWKIGQYISQRVATEEWGKSVVTELANYIAHIEPSAIGFTDKNLWRMKQFYEIYKDSSILAPVRREFEVEELAATRRQLDITATPLVHLSWTHHRTIFGRCETEEERVFYICLVIQEAYSVRELERQINSGIFERSMLGNSKPSFAKDLAPDLSSPFKDHYVFEFLNLPESHSEKDLQKAILQNLKKFLLEFSRDFAFLGEEFSIQVGSKDFSLDLLFFNRALNALVAIELKVIEFIPEHLGKLNFYLEALDRDVKKAHENPSIGILLCKSKDDEVVEYAMSRQLSAAMVAKYQLQLPDKKLLQAKLHDFFENTNKQEHNKL